MKTPAKLSAYLMTILFVAVSVPVGAIDADKLDGEATSLAKLAADCVQFCKDCAANAQEMCILVKKVDCGEAAHQNCNCNIECTL